MRDNFIITRAAELDALGGVREFIARVCAQLRIPSQVTFDLQLACDEAATNVIQHGYAGMNPGSLMLELRPAPKRITMILSDFGHPFEPIPSEAPDVSAIMENKPTAGFGLFFIYSTMNQVIYATDEQGNHLMLVKEFKP